jgi:polyamine oxidase
LFTVATYDYTGKVDYLDVFTKFNDAYVNLTYAAGISRFALIRLPDLTCSIGPRVDEGLVDTTARTGYSLVKSKPKNPHEMASEYYAFDWE